MSPPPNPALGRYIGSTWFLGSVIGVLTWHGAPITPTGLYDPSWFTALNWATARGLDYGTEFIFTYGPLGFSTVALATFGTATALYSALYLVALNLGLGITLFWAARRRFPPVAAFALAATVGLSITEGMVAIAFVCSALALVEDERSPARAVLGIAGPVLVAIGLLTKLNDGVVIALMVTIALATLELERPRRLLGAFAIFALVFSIGWTATGQGVGNLDDYVIRSFDVGFGWSAALAAEDPRVGWDRVAAVIIMLSVVGATVVMSRQLRASNRAALVAIVLILCFFSAKHGFVRHDPEHVSSFLSAMFLPWLVLPWSGLQRLVPVAAVAAIALISIPILGPQITEPRWDVPSRVSETSQLLTLISPARREAVEASARETIQEAYGLSPDQRELLERGTVDIEPQLVSLIWAYGLDWHPLPAFDSLVAYVPALDQSRARALLGDDPPDMVLRSRSRNFLGRFISANAAIDYRYLPWNTPAGTLAMFCRFSPLSTSQSYQVLGRRSNRCGPPRTLGAVSASYGEPVRVPARARGGGVILAKVTGLDPTLPEAIKGLIYRPDPRLITLDEGVTYPFLAANAGTGLIVWIPPRLDFPAPFRLAPNPERITITEQSYLNDGTGEVKVEFVLVPVE